MYITYTSRHLKYKSRQPNSCKSMQNYIQMHVNCVSSHINNIFHCVFTYFDICSYMYAKIIFLQGGDAGDFFIWRSLQSYLCRLLVVFLLRSLPFSLGAEVVVHSSDYYEYALGSSQLRPLLAAPDCCHVVGASAAGCLRTALLVVHDT